MAFWKAGGWRGIKSCIFFSLLAQITESVCHKIPALVSALPFLVYWCSVSPSRIGPVDCVFFIRIHIHRERTLKNSVKVDWFWSFQTLVCLMLLAPFLHTNQFHCLSRRLMLHPLFGSLLLKFISLVRYKQKAF